MNTQALLNAITSQWPVREGLSKSAWRVETVAGDFKSEPDVVISNDVDYTAHINDGKALQLALDRLDAEIDTQLPKLAENVSEELLEGLLSL